MILDVPRCSLWSSFFSLYLFVQDVIRHNHDKPYNTKSLSAENFIFKMPYFAKKLSWHSCDDEWKFVTNCLKIAPKKST